MEKTIHQDLLNIYLQQSARQFGSADAGFFQFFIVSHFKAVHKFHGQHPLAGKFPINPGNNQFIIVGAIGRNRLGIFSFLQVI